MTQRDAPGFELPGRLERILASLAGYFGQNDNPRAQRLLVNSTYRVHEEWTYDNWDGGTYGHAIYFYVPTAIYYEIYADIDGVARTICEGVNRIANVQGEHIAEVIIELHDDAVSENWRAESGALMESAPDPVGVTEDQLERLWTPGYLRLFMSHKAQFKKEASGLKEELQNFGVSCFVAHEDIEPTKEWQDEIERALFSMDVLLALLTKGFSDSNWTDQEVGVAIGRRVPIIALRMGTSPYGFIGKYQALKGEGKKAAILAAEVYDLLWKNPQLQSELAESLVTAFERSNSFNHSNDLIERLERIEHAPPALIERLERAPGKNNQVSGAFDVQAKLPRLLKRLRGRAT